MPDHGQGMLLLSLLREGCCWLTHWRITTNGERLKNKIKRDAKLSLCDESVMLNVLCSALRKCLVRFHARGARGLRRGSSMGVQIKRLLTPGGQNKIPPGSQNTPDGKQPKYVLIGARVAMKRMMKWVQGVDKKESNMLASATHLSLRFPLGSSRLHWFMVPTKISGSAKSIGGLSFLSCPRPLFIIKLPVKV